MEGVKRMKKDGRKERVNILINHMTTVITRPPPSYLFRGLLPLSFLELGIFQIQRQDWLISSGNGDAHICLCWSVYKEGRRSKVKDLGK